MLESGGAYTGCETPVLVFIIGLSTGSLRSFCLYVFEALELWLCVLVPYVSKFG